MPALGIIDIGSNAIRFSILNELRPCLPMIYSERIKIALLPEIEELGEIKQETLKNIINDFKRCKLILESYDKEYEMKLVATESIRNLKDQLSFIELIKKELNWDLTILTKEEESKITSFGVVSCIYNVNGLIFDLGGGSLEINYLNTKDKTIKTQPQSLTLGSQRLLAYKNGENGNIEEIIEKQLKQGLLDLNEKKFQYENVYFSGGGLRSIGYLYIHENNIKNFIMNGLVIKRDELMAVLNRYISMKQEDINKLDIHHISNQRKSQLKGNCSIANKVLQLLPNINNIIFSIGGVRHGLAYQLIENQTISPFLDSINYFLKNKSKLFKEVEEYIYILFKDIYQQYNVNNESLKAIIKLCQFCNFLNKDHLGHYLLNLLLGTGELAMCPGILIEQRCELAILLTYVYGENMDISLIKSYLPIKIKKQRVKQLKLLGRLTELILALQPLAYSNKEFMKLESKLKFKIIDEVNEVEITFKDLFLIAKSESWRKKMDKINNMENVKLNVSILE
ncbi:actin-like ATPase domain-containing protein [Neoconidiobolus thromboides FSU 785]|nr:actin-like ATPase domain-containing protein [Neoconidiobolus thromboides FSU 785]